MGVNNFNSSIDDKNTLQENTENTETFTEDDAKRIGKIYDKLRKDEFKAKKKEIILADILVQILKNKNYDKISILITNSLQKQIPANLLVGILSLVYINASNRIRDLHNDLFSTNLNYIHFDYKNNTPYTFNESDIPDKIQTRLGEWINDIYMSAIEDASSVFLDKCITDLQSENKNIISEFIIEIFIFFLSTVNIKIENKAGIKKYSEYILNEILHKILHNKKT